MIADGAHLLAVKERLGHSSIQVTADRYGHLFPSLEEALTARLIELDADAFTLQVDEPGDVLVRIHYSSHWDVDGPGCAVPTVDDWTRIRFASAGTWRVRQVVSRWNPLEPDRFTDCPVAG